MYRTTQEKNRPNSATCDKCSSTSMLYKHGGIECRDCGNVVYSPRTKNKFGAIRTVAKDGMKRDSKFEASVADELYIRKQAKDILDYDTQYTVEMDLHDRDGLKRMTVKHKIDFRIHHLDGSYELYEAKGVETADYKWRRRLLELFWLPLHKDHIYTVRKQGYRNKKKG